MFHPIKVVSTMHWEDILGKVNKKVITNNLLYLKKSFEADTCKYTGGKCNEY
jgi:hypothetical protein